MIQHLGPCVRLFLFFTLLTGGLYPLVMTGIGQAFFSVQANGSLIIREGKVLGSELIAQKFEGRGRFWPRPSAIDYQPLPSGGSNLGPTSQSLKTKIEDRRKQGLSHDLLYASASGLDPHISVEAALAQVPRIAEALQASTQDIEALVRAQTEDRQLGFLGEQRVNVLLLNLALSEQRVR